jgi:tRNA threonylcarbamoyladenosine biosynthesis protein TsaB
LVVLGIDTSGEAGSVALLGPGGSPAVEEVFTEGVIHGVALAPSVADLLARSGLAAKDLSLVAVGTGPGSYTGVRVGVAFAKSLAFAAGVPAVGVSSLDAMAENAGPDRPVVCARDGRRGTLYLAVYRPGPARDGEVRLVRHEDVAGLLPAGALVLGDAAERFPDLLSGGGRTLGDPSLARSSALAVARLGRRAAEAHGTEDVHDLSPVYLRPSEAEERLSGKDGE